MNHPSLPWIALAATAELPILSEPVEKAAKGVARVRTVEFPYRKLGENEEIEVANRLQGAAGILLRSGYITESLLTRLPELKVIAVHGAGVDPVDLAACAKHKILVTHTPGANANAVAELTIGLLLSLMRQIPDSTHRVQTERAWDSARHTGRELRGHTLGLIGYGQIGKRVGALAHAFGMEIRAHDPGLTDEEIHHLGASPMTFNELCAHADILSLHAPALPSTHRLIDHNVIARLKRGVLIINCARGNLIHEAALAAGLQSGQVGGAALDVLDGEPPDPQSPLFDAPNTLITPHMGGSTDQCLEAIATRAGRDIVRALKGEKVHYPVSEFTS